MTHPLESSIHTLCERLSCKSSTFSFYHQNFPSGPVYTVTATVWNGSNVRTMLQWSTADGYSLRNIQELLTWTDLHLSWHDGMTRLIDRSQAA